MEIEVYWTDETKGLRAIIKVVIANEDVIEKLSV
jgi:hypothetical protein